ncbi:hypothetical protein K493DRAFT_14215 [Basidiobolus meristosporus CBS 931.73]|uniref:Uncharacterized protein n=1 Tax=Basidiobolus meristosporus CBS 931.73 TaxID=1314790 RepID=A0A1Y1YHT3_9FUNG|nr:hypothetical protein K493DRAFT_14215 [Basidiobolus meristosporus CBS 931.73]|eukprot:ORX97488.1 hypothetical protein K493DRAFT_14215 [Basidiobolus meristosporus CBS 931.73]
MEFNIVNYRVTGRDKSPVPMPNEGHYYRRRGVRLQLKGLPRPRDAPDSSSSFGNTNWACPSGCLSVSDKRITYLADYRIDGIETVFFPLGTLDLKVRDMLKQNVVKGIIILNNAPVSISFRFTKSGDAKDFATYASMLQGSMMVTNRLVNIPTIEPLNQELPNYHEALQHERLPPYAA